MSATPTNILYMERRDGAGDYYVDEIVLPTKMEVCDRCRGRGTHTNPSIDGNGITSAEWAEWDDDDREGYLTGAYDVMCEECHGRNVMEVVDEDQLGPEHLEAWNQQVQDEYDYRAEIRAEQRMGA